MKHRIAPVELTTMSVLSFFISPYLNQSEDLKMNR